MTSAHRPPSLPAIPDAERYFNREISWLAFNDRVLEEATNRAHPLLERLRFLSISGNNLDEFYMVRVAGLRGQVRAGIETLTPEGMTPAQQLAAIAIRADKLMETQQRVWGNLVRELARADFHVITADRLAMAERTWLEKHFLDQIFPVLTPQAIDPAHPFPFISNKGFSLILELRRQSDDELLRALLMLPSMLPRFIRLPGAAIRFISLENTIRAFFGQLFPGYDLIGDGAFRVIRDSDIEVEEEAEDLVRFYQTALKRRRRGEVIRLKIEASTPSGLNTLVQNALGVGERDTTVVTGVLGVADLALLVDEDRPDLKF
ncbi:MAG: RNA degradosome polyphosphate kinase, partial [Polymorphobacter sp.]